MRPDPDRNKRDKMQNKPFVPFSQTGGLPFLNIAATCPATEALGPGRRAVVWVQGCPFHCAGCIAEEWIPSIPARQVPPEALVEELLETPGLSGLTFSGGEPMMQAAGLAQVIRLARRRQPLSLVCYSGFTIERLRSSPPMAGVPDLLSEIDVLIDGPYVARLNDNRGLRGSSNQRVHYLTDTLKEYDFVDRRRNVELRIEDGYVLMVGVPPQKLVSPLSQAINRANVQVAGRSA